MDGNSVARNRRTSVPVELGLAAVNLALAGWTAWATLNSPGAVGPRSTMSWHGWISRGYVLEVLLLAFGVIAAVLGTVHDGTRPLRLLWACLGALIGLAVLGAWSLGLWLLPGVLLVLAAGALAAVRTGARFGPLLAWTLTGLTCQIAFMLLVIAIVLATG